VSLELDFKCDVCKSRMIEGESAYCEACYRELVLENEKLQIKISELEDQLLAMEVNRER